MSPDNIDVMIKYTMCSICMVHEGCVTAQSILILFLATTNVIALKFVCDSASVRFLKQI